MTECLLSPSCGYQSEDPTVPHFDQVLVIGKGYENPWGMGQGYVWVRVGVSFFDPWQTLTLGVGWRVGRGFG